MKKNQFYIFIVGSLYMIVTIPVAVYLNSGVHLFMTWNMFLSMIVLLLGYFSVHEKITALHPVLYVIYVGIWLLFFPNSFYFITDLLHLSRYEFMVDIGYMAIIFTQDIMNYVALAHLFIGCMISVYYGYISLMWVLQSIESKFKIVNKHYIIIGVSLLSSFGIAIGRFMRFNSWDVLLFWRLISGIVDNMSWFIIQFTFVFFLIHLFIIYGYNYVTNHSNKLV